MTYQTAAPIEHLSLTVTARIWGDLSHQIERGILSYDVPYQRGDAWTTGQRMLLIHSILSGTPIPAIIVNRRPQSAWTAPDGTYLPSDVVIDGKQRLVTMRMWLGNLLTVPASWFPPDEILLTEDTDDGPYVRYGGLSRRQQRFFEMSATVPVAEATLPSVAEEAAVYLRVNGGGTPQSGEDMAKAAVIAGGSSL